MVLSFSAASVGVAMSEKFLRTIFFISRLLVFSRVAVTMPNTVAPACLDSCSKGNFRTFGCLLKLFYPWDAAVVFSLLHASN